MPARAHRDAVGDRDGVELHRRAAGLADALLDLRGQRAQVEVARHRLDPGRGHADDRLGQGLVVVADALQVGARGGALGPSVRARQLCLRSKPVSVLTGRQLTAWATAASPALSPAGASRWRSHSPGARGRGGPAWDRPGGRAGACWRSAIRRSLVAGERHPLGQHVVGVGQPRAAVGPRLVRELDAVLVEQLARLRQVGDDRLVGVDQVGVRRAAGSRPPARALAAPQTRMKPRSRYISHSSSLTQRAQELAGALLGAALAARVVADGAGRAARRARAALERLARCAARRPPTAARR